MVFRGVAWISIAGVTAEALLIMDPVNGTNVVEWGVFPGSYFGGAKLDDYVFTKKN